MTLCVDPVGVDTVLAFTMRFILGMILNPDAQRRAQEEIDRVVGKNRLPTLDESVETSIVLVLIDI